MGIYSFYCLYPSGIHTCTFTVFAAISSLKNVLHLLFPRIYLCNKEFLNILLPIIICCPRQLFILPMWWNLLWELVMSDIQVSSWLAFSFGYPYTTYWLSWLNSS